MSQIYSNWIISINRGENESIFELPPPRLSYPIAAIEKLECLHFKRSKGWSVIWDFYHHCQSHFLDVSLFHSVDGSESGVHSPVEVGSYITLLTRFYNLSITE